MGKQNLEDKCKIKVILEETTPLFLRLTNRHYSEYPRNCANCSGYEITKICYLPKENKSENK